MMTMDIAFLVDSQLFVEEMGLVAPMAGHQLFVEEMDLVALSH